MRRTTWFLVAAPWVLAVLTAATLAWAVPRADDAAPVDGRMATLRQRITTLEDVAETAAARVTALRQRAKEMREERETLAARERRMKRRVAELEARIAQLRQQAAAEAAAEAEADVPTVQRPITEDEAPAPRPGDDCQGGYGDEECPPG